MCSYIVTTKSVEWFYVQLMYYSAAVMDSKKLKMIQTYHVNYFCGKSYCVFNNVIFNNIMVCYTNLACLIKNVISVPLAAFLSCFYYIPPGMTGGTL